KRNRNLLFQLAFAAGILLLVWLSFGQTVLAPRKGNGMPQKFVGLKLMDVVEGAGAMAQIDRMHATGIELVTATIGTYELNNQKITVWAGIAADSIAAEQLLSRMVEAISRGNPSFSNLRKISVTQGYHSHEIFLVDGPGGKHAFYISKLSRDKVVWLAVENGDTQAVIEGALDVF
ncbi:MAG: hypothetical protein U1D67_06125, partial [Dehalococcoidia bacterium]|nr:hypothetical protein [Dehalococcoidia bacterium]